MSDKAYLVRIAKLAKATAKEIKKVEASCGTYEDPVNTDMVKTLKAMFYEDCIEVLKERKRENDG